MHFLIIAHDYRDPEAPDRRQRQRPAHVEGVRRLRDRGQFVEGGAMMNDEGRIVGSMVLVDFPSRAEVESWIAADPYTTGQVWEHVTVQQFRRVQL